MSLRILFCFAVIGLVVPANFAQGADETYGTMMVVKGDIKVAQAKTGKTEAAKVGFKVYSGDTITAGADSRAKIVMSDKNVINISPDSKMTIEKYENKGEDKNVELKVDYGKVRASVEQKYDGEKNKFNVKTPTAVAGVRGTDFMAGFNPQTKASQITTFSGVVAVGTPGPNGQILNPVFVKPGQTTSVGTGKAPEPPKAMPKEELNNLNKESSADTAKSDKGAGDKSTAKADAKADDKKDDKKDQKDAAADKKADGSADKKDQKQDGSADKKADSQTDSKKSDTKKTTVDVAPPPAAAAAGGMPSAVPDPATGAGNAPSQPTTADAGGAGPASRSPASTDKPTMISASDLNTVDLSKTINANPVSQTGPTVAPIQFIGPGPTPPPQPPKPPDGLQKSNVKITIH